MRGRTQLSLAAMLGLMAGMNALPQVREPDRSVSKNNKMPLTPEESMHLSTLHGKNKKIYIKKLRQKYSKKG